MIRWPHQIRGVAETIAAFEAGETAVCLSSPTGGGKSLMATDLIRWALERGLKAALYTTRKLLTEQLIRTLSDANVPFGVRAAGYEAWTDDGADVQICSSPTEHRRVFVAREKCLDAAEALTRYRLFEAGLVIIDEIHMQKAATVEQIVREHLAQGAVLVGLTATPIEVSHICNQLILAGTKSELRSYDPPALVPALTFSCAEIDTRKIKRDAKTGEFSQTQLRRIYTTHIYGHVVDEFRKLNPDNRPTLVFWPGVEESVYGCRVFNEAGIPSTHVDGEDIEVDGERLRSDQERRDDVLRRHREGRLVAIHNRWVLREGVDLPYVQHLVLATPVGSLVAYVQIVGRVLRYHPSHEHVTIQDHGGNWWRHPSPNADIEWEQFWDLPARTVSDHHERQQQQRIREGKELELPCEHCGKVLKTISKPCPACGRMTRKRGRMVIQESGALRHMPGDPVRVPRIDKRPRTEMEQHWEACWFRCRHSDMTFAQARGLYIHECCKRRIGYVEPPMDLPRMPLDPLDWYRKIKDVPLGRLVPSVEVRQQRQREPSLF